MTKLNLKIPDKVPVKGGVQTPPVVSQTTRCKRRYRTAGGRTFKCCVWEGLDSFLVIGIILGVVVLAACMHFVGRPYMRTPDLTPTICTVNKIVTPPKTPTTGASSTDPKPPQKDGDDKDGMKPPRPGMDDDDKDGHRDHHDGRRGSHHGDWEDKDWDDKYPGDHHRGKRSGWRKRGGSHEGGKGGRRHNRNRGMPVEGLDYPDKNGMMACQDCYFDEVSRCKKGDKDYYSSKMCTVSKFPCVKVIVSYEVKDHDDSSEEDSSWEDYDSSEEEYDDSLEDHPREDKPPPKQPGGKHSGEHHGERDEDDRDHHDKDGRRHKRQTATGHMPPPPPGAMHGPMPRMGKDIDMQQWLKQEEGMWEDYIGGHLSDEEWREIKEFLMKDWTEEDWEEAMEWVKENFDTEDWTDEEWAKKKEWLKEMKSKCKLADGMMHGMMPMMDTWTEEDWEELAEWAKEPWSEDDWEETAEWIDDHFDTEDWTEEMWEENKEKLRKMKESGASMEEWKKLKAAWDKEGGDWMKPHMESWKKDLDLGDGTAVLHTDVANMENFPQCSYSVCHSDETENAEKVIEWTSTWVEKQKSGEEFDCYYDPEDPTRAFVGRLYSRAEVANAILWPAAFAIVCLFVLIGRRIYFGCTKRQVGTCRANPYAVTTPEPEMKEKDPEKDPESLGPEVQTPRPLELSVASCPPEYKEVIEASGDRPVAIVLPPTYSEANLHKAAKDELPICDA